MSRPAKQIGYQNFKKKKKTTNKQKKPPNNNNNKHNKRVFRTQLNIYDGAFLQK